jgi:hypothetical protein
MPKVCLVARFMLGDTVEIKGAKTLIKRRGSTSRVQQGLCNKLSKPGVQPDAPVMSRESDHRQHIGEPRQARFKANTSPKLLRQLLNSFFYLVQSSLLRSI